MASAPDSSPNPAEAAPASGNADREMDTERFDEGDESDGEPVDDVAQEMRSADDAGSEAALDTETTSMDDAVWHAPRGPRTKIVAVVLLVFMALSVLALAVMAVLALVK